MKRSIVYKLAYGFGRMCGVCVGGLIGWGVRWRLKFLCKTLQRDDGPLLDLVRAYLTDKGINWEGL